MTTIYQQLYEPEGTPDDFLRDEIEAERKRKPLSNLDTYQFKCMECGKKFRTAGAASKAANNGCPKCGGVDIDLA